VFEKTDVPVELVKTSNGTQLFGGWRTSTRFQTTRKQSLREGADLVALVEDGLRGRVGRRALIRRVDPVMHGEAMEQSVDSAGHELPPLDRLPTHQQSFWAQAYLNRS